MIPKSLIYLKNSNFRLCVYFLVIKKDYVISVILINCNIELESYIPRYSLSLNDLIHAFHVQLL